MDNLFMTEEAGMYNGGSIVSSTGESLIFPFPVNRVVSERREKKHSFTCALTHLVPELSWMRGAKAKDEHGKV